MTEQGAFYEFIKINFDDFAKNCIFKVHKFNHLDALKYIVISVTGSTKHNDE